MARKLASACGCLRDWAFLMSVIGIGLIKLEDVMVVTDEGFDIYGDGARGWNRGGTAA